MTLDKHIFAIKNRYSQTAVSDDIPYSDRLIQDALIIARAEILKIELNKRNSISPENYSTFCLEFEDSNFGCTAPSVILDTIRQSVEDLPSTINTKWGLPLKVYTVNGEPIPQTNLALVNYASCSIASSDNLAYYPLGSKIALTNGDMIKTLVVKAIVEDPSVIPGTTNCSQDEIEFPIDASLVSVMRAKALQDLLQGRHAIDTLNNSSNLEINAQQVQNTN